jgi:NTE family protein
VSERLAVILGGGGVTGIAWETGVLLGLEGAGVQLAGADAIIGTSAGSFAGTYLATGVLEKYFDAQFDDEVTELAATMSPETIDAYLKAIADGDGDAERTARGLGRMAMAATTVSVEARAAVVAARLPSADWPDAPLRMTAIDAESGVLHLFDKTSGVPIVTAAAASGAVPGLWPVVTALDRRWIDGGSCSPTNAALGADYDRVVVIAPAADGLPGMRGTHSEVADLVVAGVGVTLIVPDERTTEAVGPNVFDPARRGPAAAAGRLQGAAAATEVSRALRL